MAQLGGDEKADVVVVNQPGGLDSVEDGIVQPQKYSEIYTCHINTDNNKNELKLEVQNKRTKQLFKGIYTLDKLVKCGFNPQQSLNDIKSTLQSAFDTKEGLTLTISLVCVRSSHL